MSEHEAGSSDSNDLRCPPIVRAATVGDFREDKSENTEAEELDRREDEREGKFNRDNVDTTPKDEQDNYKQKTGTKQEGEESEDSEDSEDSENGQNGENEENENENELTQETEEMEKTEETDNETEENNFDENNGTEGVPFTIHSKKRKYKDWDSKNSFKRASTWSSSSYSCAPKIYGGIEQSPSTLRCQLKLDDIDTVLQIRKGDITEECVDAIVNAANGYLAHGGGVAGAIIRKGGYIIQTESDEYIRENGKISTGGVAITQAGNLPCRYVIHAVGPIWRDGDEERNDNLLESAVWQSLIKAQKENLTSISVPAISSGIFGFPKDRCAQIMLKQAVKFMKKNPHTCLKHICFTNFDEPTVNCFLRAVDALGIGHVQHFDKDQ